jgi:hypothetical protein
VEILSATSLPYLCAQNVFTTIIIIRFDLLFANPGGSGSVYINYSLFFLYHHRVTIQKCCWWLKYTLTVLHYTNSRLQATSSHPLYIIIWCTYSIITTSFFSLLEWMMFSIQHWRHSCANSGFSLEYTCTFSLLHHGIGVVHTPAVANNYTVPFIVPYYMIYCHGGLLQVPPVPPLAIHWV